jgi:oligo-1,6-glucosidase
MQWNASSRNAGFCKENVKPWMRVMDDYKSINAETQLKAEDPAQLSIWQFWQRGLKDRKEHADAFVYGDYQEISPDDANVFSYLRTSASGDRWLVVLNFSGNEQKWSIPSDCEADTWVCSTYTKSRADKPQSGSVVLKPWEGILAKCKS